MKDIKYNISDDRVNTEKYRNSTLMKKQTALGLDRYRTILVRVV